MHCLKVDLTTKSVNIGSNSLVSKSWVVTPVQIQHKRGCLVGWLYYYWTLYPRTFYSRKYRISTTHGNFPVSFFTFFDRRKFIWRKLGTPSQSSWPKDAVIDRQSYPDYDTQPLALLIPKVSLSTKFTILIVFI